MAKGLGNLTRREFISIGGTIGLATLLPAYKDSGKDLDALEAEYQKGLQRFNQAGRIDVTFFTPIVEKFPKSDKAHFLMGNIYFISRFPDSYRLAIEEYDKAIALNPEFAAAYINKGNAVWYMNESRLTLDDAIEPSEFIKTVGQRAINEYDKAIQLEPKLFSAHNNKGVVSKHKGEKKQAIEILTTAINLKAKIGGPYETTVKGEDKTLYYGGVEPMFVMSSFCRNIIDVGASIEVKGQRVIQLSKEMTFISNENDPTAFAYYHRGTAYASNEIRSYKKAVEDFDKAIELNPNVPYFYFVKYLSSMGLNDIGKALSAQIENEKAVERIRKLVKR